MDIKLEYTISIKEFLEVVESVGWKTYSEEQINKALNNTMYMVKAIVDGKLAGIGRVVGDYSIVCMLSDVCVKPEFQGKGRALRRPTYRRLHQAHSRNDGQCESLQYLLRVHGRRLQGQPVARLGILLRRRVYPVQ